MAASLLPGNEAEIQTGRGFKARVRCVRWKTSSGQKNPKNPLYLQLVLAGVKYSGDTEQDRERNEMKVSRCRLHLAFQALAQTHSGV